MAAALGRSTALGRLGDDERAVFRQAPEAPPVPDASPLSRASGGLAERPRCTAPAAGCRASRTPRALHLDRDSVVRLVLVPHQTSSFCDRASSCCALVTGRPANRLPAALPRRPAGLLSRPPPTPRPWRPLLDTSALRLTLLQISRIVAIRLASPLGRSLSCRWRRGIGELHTVTGGTGDFVDATGMLKLVGTFDPVTGGEIVYQGRISHSVVAPTRTPPFPTAPPIRRRLRPWPQMAPDGASRPAPPRPGGGRPHRTCRLAVNELAVTISRILAVVGA